MILKKEKNKFKKDQGSTFSLVQININKYIYINIYYTFYSFLSSFVYYTHVKFVFKEASEQLLQDNMSDNVHLGEFYACYIFLFLSLSLSLSLLLPSNPPVQVCTVNIKKSTFSLECCRQSVSGRVQSLQGVRAL